MKYLLPLTAASVMTVCVWSAQTGVAGRAEAQPAGDTAKLNEQWATFLKPVEIAAGDSELTKKLKERHNSAVALLNVLLEEFKSGRRDINVVYEAARLAAESKLDLAEDTAARVEILEQTLKLAKSFEAQLQQRLSAGFGSKADFERARYGRLAVEVQLLRAKQNPQPKPN